MEREVTKTKATKGLAFCSFCGHLSTWEKDKDGWRCSSCGVIRGSEPPWARKESMRGRTKKGRARF